VQTSAYVGATSTLAGTTATAAAFQGDLTQTDGLGLGPTAFITVTGTSAFQSTLQTTTTQLYNQPAGFGSTFTVAGTTTATATFSTLGSLYVAADTRTDSNYNANTLSTISYNALATAHPVKAGFGTSNATSYSAYVQGNTAATGFITAATSSFTVSTATASFSSITFLDGATPYRIAGSNGAILLNETAITSATYAPFFSTILASNYVDVRGEFRTSTLQVNLANPTSYNASSLQYTLEARGNMYVSTAFVMDNLAVYGDTNPTLYTTPTFNTLYASTNGLLINNRLFVDGIQNRVGVNNTNPAYTLDISAQLFVNATNVFNIGTTSWIVASDSALKENIQDVSGAALDSYSAVVEALPLKRYRYKDNSGSEVGFANQYRLGSAYRYGFIAQDVELFFPNAVYETPFYKYADFNFLTTGPIFNAQYAITRTMVSTVVGHSTIVGHRREFISTVSQRQKNILGDLSGAVGAPYSAITIGVDGRWSTAALLMPPTGLVVKYKDLGFDLSWNPSPSPGMTYRVKIASGGVETVYPIGTANTYSVDGLTNLVQYTFKVVGYSSYLKQETAFITSTATAYNWPLVLGVTITPTTTSFTFIFTPNLTGGTFVKYKIYDSAGTTLLYDNIPNADYTISTGLQQGVDYVYKVSVVTNENGVIQESAQFTTDSVRLNLVPKSYFVDTVTSMTITKNDILTRRYLRYYLMGGGGAGGRGSFGNPWSSKTLSLARYKLAATSLGDIIYFGGGTNDAGGVSASSIIDSYDVSTDVLYTTSNNSSFKIQGNSRFSMAAAALGTKVVFAGGYYSGTGASKETTVLTLPSSLSPASSATFSTLTLVSGRWSFAAAAAGTKILFVGGQTGTTLSSTTTGGAVQIYDVSSGTWAPGTTLTNGRGNLAAAASGTKILFGGGFDGTSYSAVVNIYDVSTGIWTTSNLPGGARGYLAAAAAGTKIVFAGGQTGTNIFTNKVDIYDVSSGTWATTTTLQGGSRGNLAAASAGTKVFFAGGQTGGSTYSAAVDIYDVSSNTWTTSTLPGGARAFLAGAGAGNKVVFAGGQTGTNSYSAAVDIFDITIPNIYVAGGGGGGSGQARGYLPFTNGSKNYTLTGNTPTEEYIDLSGKTFTDIDVSIGAGATGGQAQGGSTTITLRNNTTTITIVDASGGFSGADASNNAPGSGGAGFFGGGGGVGNNFNGSNVSGGPTLGGGYAGSTPSRNDTSYIFISGAGAGPGSSTAGAGSRTLDKASLTELEKAGIGGGGGGGNYLGAAAASGGSIDNATRVLAVAGTAYTGQGGGGGVKSDVATEVSPGAGGAGFAILEFTNDLPSGTKVA
jgi:kelch-like protein 20